LKENQTILPSSDPHPCSKYIKIKIWKEFLGSSLFRWSLVNGWKELWLSHFPSSFPHYLKEHAAQKNNTMMINSLS
jgi:hypothetical protein